VSAGTNKWVFASVVNDAGTVIGRVFEEAERRGSPHPGHAVPRL
jgi:hypothetical protein